MVKKSENFIVEIKGLMRNLNNEKITNIREMIKKDLKG